jgi:hypothetical protein
MMVSFMVSSSQTVYRLNMKEWLQVAYVVLLGPSARRWTCAVSGGGHHVVFALAPLLVVSLLVVRRVSQRSR